MLPGVLLVGHGTRSEIGAQQFLDFAAGVARRLAPLPMEAAFLELRPPEIQMAVERLLRRGADRLVTVPLLLFAAGHVKEDIPDAVREAVADAGARDLPQAITGHFGCHPALVELSRQRMNEAIGGRPPISPEATCLLLVGRGSRDAGATAEMHEFALLRQLACPAMRVEVGFLAMAHPDVQTQLRAVAAGEYRRVVVQPHLLFRGELVEKLSAAMETAAAASSGPEWIFTEVLSDGARQSARSREAGDRRPPPHGGNHLLEKVIFDRLAAAGIRIVAPCTDD